MAKQEKYGKLTKDRMAKELEKRFEDHPNFILTSFMGSSVSDLESLRKTLKKSSSQYFVVKNSILKVVFDKLKLNDMASQVDGGVGVSFSGDDIVSTCKTLVTFTKDHDKLKIKLGILDGRSVTPDEVKKLASIPSREILLAQVVGGVKAPITGFVNTLSGMLRKFVYVVDAIKSKKT